MTHNNNDDDDASSDKEWEDSQNHDDDDDDDHHQMPKHDDFVTLLRRLQSPIIISSSSSSTNNNHTAHSSSTNHDPKAIRLAAVTCAILDLIPTTTNTTSKESSSTTVTAAQVYAQALTALEGTLKVTTTTTRSTPNNNNNNNDPTTTATTTTTTTTTDDDADTTSMMMKVQMDTWATTIAILELLCQTIPYIATTPGSSNIVGLTLSTFATRIFRAVIQTTTLSSSSSLWMHRTALDAMEQGGASRTAVLRSVGRTSTILLQHVPRMTKESAVREFLTGTLWTLFYHETPKVRKAAQSGLMEVVLMPPPTTTRHASILPTVNAIVQQELQSIMMATNDDDQQHRNQMLQQRSLQLLPFLERTIYYLNYPEITRLIMMYLTSLSQSMIRTNHHHENDYVTTTGVVVKVQESTFKVRVLASILNFVGTLWQSETNDDDDTTRTAAQSFQHELALRVMATLLQLKSQFRLITMNRMTTTMAAVEYETSVETTRLFGHVLLTACHNVSLQNDDDTNWETYCTLLPLSIQAVLQLCQPPPTPHATAAGPHHRHRTTTIPQTALFMELTQLIRSKMPLLVGRMESSSSSTKLSKLITKCCHDVLSCMKQVLLGDNTYSSTWSVSLPMMSILIQHVHSIMPHEEMASIIESFIVLHNDSTTTTKGKQDIENAWSTLFQGVGIETLWSWIAWTDPNHRHDSSTTTTTVSKSKSNDNMIISNDRAWILSILKTAANHTSGGRAPRLEFFQHHVLALARQCDTLSKQSSPLPSQKKSPVRHAARTRVIDLWNLFPCFCSPLPCDLVQALPSLNVTLVRVLEDKRYPELLTVICHGLTAMVKSYEAISADEQEAMYDERNALGATAKALLPTLFKFVTETHEAASSNNHRANDPASMEVDATSNKKSITSSNPMDSFQKLQCVSDAISALARLAPDGYMKGLFKKLMQSLLDEVQSEACDNERICAYLTLSQALVASKVLDESSSISFLYRALKPLITNHTDGGGTARVQKRAYKVLNEICERYHSFVTASERLHELSVLLTGTIGTSQVSARFMRLKCLTLIVDGFDESNKNQLNEMYKVIPEVLLCLKDSNGKTRDAAYQLIVSMAVRGNIVEFVKVTLAALGSETSHMRSAVIMALSRLVFEQGWANDEFHALLPSLLKTVLVLINEGSREVIKSVVGFVRICVAAIPADQLEPLVPELVGSMLKSQHVKSRFRAKTKIILKKLVKLYGYDALMPHVPASETRLLSHMRKLDEREQRKKQASRNERAANINRPNLEDYDAMFESDEDDSDDGRTLMTGATGLTRRTKHTMMADDAKSISSKRSKMTSATGMTSKSKSSIYPNLRLPNEADGEIVDLLSPSIAKKVHQYDNDDDSDDDDDDSAEMMFDDDGKLMVRDDDDDNDGRQSTTVEMDEIIPMQGSNKRRRLMSSSSSFQSKGQSSQSSGGINSTQKKNRNKNVPSIGASYKSKKAGGDVKKKGQQYEPYAYVPLDGRAYTKKHRRTAVEQMSTVVRNGGGSGGNKGGKAFRSNQKNNKRKR